jgi:NitT/TauT family transport system ATP-binding protein
MESIITLSGISLAFGHKTAKVPVLDRLDLSVARGEFLALVGASGVGKSTLLRVIMGLAQPDSGTVTIPLQTDPLRRICAMVFQDARLLPWRRVLANVAFGLEKLPLNNSQRRDRAREALALVGLSAFEDRFPHELSGGQKQRISLARALALTPDILLMDEPFSALDALTRESLQDELIRIRRETGTTILFVTHDIDEAVYMADRVVVLGGSPSRIVSTQQFDIPHPRERSDAGLLATVTHLRRELSADWVSDGAGV